MYNPWFETVDRTQFKLQKLTATSFLLEGFFADAAASYMAKWLIVDGIAVRTQLDYTANVPQFRRGGVK
jgi:hypothetical protein